MYREVFCKSQNEILDQRTIDNQTCGIRIVPLRETGECSTIAYSSHPYFDWRWWDNAKEFKDIALPPPPYYEADEIHACQPGTFANFCWVLETALNAAYINPLFRSIQLVKFFGEAKAFVEVECADSRVRRGWLTWTNSD